MKKAAVGFRVHSGWSAVVGVCLEKGAPVVLRRQRVHLVKTFTYAFRQPYHTAEKMEFAAARGFVAGAQKEARELACRAIRDLQRELEEAGFQLTRGAMLLAAGRPLPELSKILASHALIHTADGVLFREALIDASGRCGLAVVSIRERELLQQAANRLGARPATLLRKVTELGRPLGAPWSQDEKFAALAAWLALLTPVKNSRRTPSLPRG